MATRDDLIRAYHSQSDVEIAAAYVAGREGYADESTWNIVADEFRKRFPGLDLKAENLNDTRVAGLDRRSLRRLANRRDKAVQGLEEHALSANIDETLYC